MRWLPCRNAGVAAPAEPIDLGRPRNFSCLCCSKLQGGKERPFEYLSATTVPGLSGKLPFIARVVSHHGAGVYGEIRPALAIQVPE